MAVNYYKLQTYRAFDPFFEEGDTYCALNIKEMDLSEVTGEVSENSEFTLMENACQYCKKMFPNCRLLETHLLETHDQLFKLMATKKSMYGCIVEGCKESFPDVQARKDHLVSQHWFPSNYRYVLMPSKALSSDNGNCHTIEEGTSEQPHPTGSVPVSAKNRLSSSNGSNGPTSITVPTSITFGRGRGTFSHSSSLSKRHPHSKSSQGKKKGKHPSSTTGPLGEPQKNSEFASTQFETDMET